MKWKHRSQAENTKLLFKVLRARSPEVATRLADGWLNPGDPFIVCQKLTEELMESGLNQDDEPNERGRRLEELTSIFSSLGIEHEGGSRIPVPSFLPKLHKAEKKQNKGGNPPPIS